jgi:hypothetical protein
VDEFLNDDGIFGGVIPISILRGRESQKIRDFIFSNWTPLYVIKSTYNYGFSEWSEYRDILLIARKNKPHESHHVKFVLIKKDLKELAKSDVSHIANLMELKDSLRSDELDIESFSVKEMRERFANLMWFCGVSKLKNRDALVSFISRFSGTLTSPPLDYFREGYRPVPEGVSSFMFLTRNLEESRTGQAFLFFNSEGHNSITAKSIMGIDYRIEKSSLANSLRTGIGISVFDLSGKLDYIANVPYKELDKVLKASKFEKPSKFDWIKYWGNVERELEAVKTKIVAVHRINPFSPSTYLISFFSQKPFSPSNVLNVINEEDDETAKAFCVLFNSALFLSQFFLLKEETTGRYINIRFYDYYEMNIFPKREKIRKLARVFDEYSKKKFLCLREQLDEEFDQRYDTFWEEKRKGQRSLFSMKQAVTPSKVRLDFDLSVCKALGVPVTKEELCNLYKVIVEEMIITRGLTRD